ncbi:MAG: HAD family hydrolase [Bacteriovoracaceae bacterium]
MMQILDRFPTTVKLKQSYPEMKAIFFDMDGTLFDTEIYHTKAMLEIAAQYKIQAPYSPDVIHSMLIGKADYLVFEIIKDWPGFPSSWSAQDFVDEKNKHFLKIMEKEDGDNYFAPDLALFLQEARAQNIYLSLVTSSERIVTEKLLGLVGLNSFFDLVLTRDDCPFHKPHPWPYLKAIESAQCLPHEAIIFEDSPIGLEAAKASSAHVIKVEWY